jgi:hypothetical protein
MRRRFCSQGESAFYDLGLGQVATLAPGFQWGDGLTQRSQRVRRRPDSLPADYFASPPFSERMVSSDMKPSAAPYQWNVALRNC